MSKKIRLTESDINKARIVFKMLHGTMLPDKYLLPKSMLKALERKGLVEKIKIFGARKYADLPPTMRYLWIWKNKDEMNYASATSSENKG